MSTNGWAAVAREIRDRIVNDGGYTWSPYEDGEPDSGYMVSLNGYEQTYRLNDFRLIGDGMVTVWASRADVQAAINVHGTWFGAWVDGDTVYLDVSEHVTDRETALRLGAERDQLAVWDVAAGKEIRVTGPSRRLHRSI